jgi:predicted Zn-ribbon and HTH transcriptional regulator
MREVIQPLPIKSKSEVLRLISEISNNEYEMIGDYTMMVDKVLFRHNKCGHEWGLSPNQFINSGTRCPLCNRKRKTKSHRTFVNEVYNLVGCEYSILSYYVRAASKLTIKHNNCGHVFEMAPNDFLRGRRCSKCKWSKIRKAHAKSQKDFEDEIRDISDGEYKVLSQYKNAHTKIKMKHLVCSYEWEVFPYGFVNQGTRCPNCVFSRGEKRIKEFLNNLDLEFKIGYRFEGCKNKRELPFDFYIADKLLIEFDGEGHFMPFRFSKNTIAMTNKLKESQRNDLIKNQFCIKNRIPLIRIPYWETKNIELIVENALVRFKIIENLSNVNRYLDNFLVDESWDHDKYINKVKLEEVIKLTRKR